MMKTLSATLRASSDMALERHSRLPGFSAVFFGFLLLWNTATPTIATCRADLSGWTEVTFRDVITGRYGVDREPVFVSDCKRSRRQSVRTVGR
jgi:hypothetical protein